MHREGLAVHIGNVAAAKKRDRGKTLCVHYRYRGLMRAKCTLIALHLYRCCGFVSYQSLMASPRVSACGFWDAIVKKRGLASVLRRIDREMIPLVKRAFRHNTYVSALLHHPDADS